MVAKIDRKTYLHLHMISLALHLSCGWSLEGVKSLTVGANKFIMSCSPLLCLQLVSIVTTVHQREGHLSISDS